VAVNDTTVKSAPKGAIDQIGECLSRIVHAFAEASEDAKYLWQSGILKMVFGEWIAAKAMNGTLRMYYHKH
jgi:hypothetical protein